jgi:LPXTG-motif cell wall-anchored protein
VRILGRKGVLSLNAVAGVHELPLVKKDIDQVLKIASFTEGNQYKDFDSNVDEVAAYTIGGLVAGKVLMKVGFFALILKNIKLVIIGVAALGAGIFKFFRRKKKPEELAYEAPVDNPPTA